MILCFQSVRTISSNLLPILNVFWKTLFFQMHNKFSKCFQKHLYDISMIDSETFQKHTIHTYPIHIHKWIWILVVFFHHFIDENKPVFSSLYAYTGLFLDCVNWWMMTLLLEIVVKWYIPVPDTQYHDSESDISLGHVQKAFW